MVTAGYEENFVRSFEPENYPVTPVDAETPVLPLEGLEFLGLKRWMKGIFAKQPFPPLGFPLDWGWELLVAPLKFFGVLDFDHRRRSWRKLRRRFVLPSAMSLSERERLLETLH